MSLTMPRAGSWRRLSALRRRARPLVAPVAGWANRDMRRTIVLCIAVICACFMGAVALLMWRSYSDAFGDAEGYARAQAAALAADTGRQLDRMEALSIAYLNAVDEPSARGVLAAESGRLLNIALADASGHFISAMHGQALAAQPLPAAAVQRAMHGRVAGAYADPAIGASALLVMFRADKETPARFVVVLLNPAGLVPAYAIGGGALLSPDGAALALGSGWTSPPPEFALRTDRRGSDIRYVGDKSGQRLVAIAPVPGWPLSAAASVTAREALTGWYAALPLYLFLLLGIALTAFGTARVLMRRIETRPRPEGAPLPGQLVVDARDTALRARLSDAEKRSQEAERAKAEFLAHMSHELRTPLNAIIGFAEIIEADLLAGQSREKYVEYASDIARAARSLHARLGEILELAAMAGDQHELKGETTDATEVARECIDQVRGFAQARNIRLNTNLPALPEVRADAVAIKRILIVLLSNALRFTQDGGNVDLDARKFDKEVILTVRDTGQGPSPEGTPPRPPLRDKDRSFGLGFAMATTLARRMGGSVRISGMAAGAVAELRLPVAEIVSQTAARRATLRG